MNGFHPARDRLSRNRLHGVRMKQANTDEKDSGVHEEELGGRGGVAFGEGTMVRW